jgi:CheY-like chemotaxis protein
MTRILVVDDELAIRTLIADVLTESGYEVSLASNGSDAMTAISLARPDVVLLDLIMPGMDGWAFLRTWQESVALRGLPIAVLSATTLDDSGLLTSGGPVRFIPKPFDLGTLLQTVAELATHSAVRYSVLHPNLARRGEVLT